jgi:hypothetical protein
MCWRNDIQQLTVINPGLDEIISRINIFDEIGKILKANPYPIHR